jgi:hypothetical protein
MRIIRTFEKFESRDVLIIVDVQKSFRKFFTELYVNELTKHCKNFKEVYLIWDNHHEKDNDKSYLYEDEPDIPISGDFYNFPNLKEIIEKRYNYKVDVDFYKKLLSQEIYSEVKNLEESNKLKKGDIFPTNQGTYIVYIGNNHVWFHVGKKLKNVLSKLNNKKIEIVGGSDSECLEDIVTSAESLGVKITRNHKFIWSASHCPIK